MKLFLNSKIKKSVKYTLNVTQMKLELVNLYLKLNKLI